MPHQYVRNAQEKSRCGIASMQTFSFTHPACAFLQKIKSSITLMYLEPHKGHVITSGCQEYSAFFCQHSFRMCGLNCQLFCWPLTACESLPCSPASYLLFPISCASLVCIYLGVGLVFKFHAQDHTVGSVYTFSRATFTHQPHRIILKWTQSMPRQAIHFLFPQPVPLQHRKG